MGGLHSDAAQAKLELTAVKTQELNTYIDKFTGASVPFGDYDITDFPKYVDNVLAFAVFEVLHEEGGKYYSSDIPVNTKDFGEDDGSWYVSKEKVDAAIYRYFGIAGIQHRSVDYEYYDGFYDSSLPIPFYNGRYYVPFHDGVSWQESNVIELYDNGNGTLSVIVEISNRAPGSGWDADEGHLEKYFSSAVIQPYYGPDPGTGTGAAATTDTGAGNSSKSIGTYRLLYWKNRIGRYGTIPLRQPLGGGTGAAPATPVKVFLNGRQIMFDQLPIMENDRVLVPIRAIVEAMGAAVSWDERSQTATITQGGTAVTITLGSADMAVGGTVVKLDVPARSVGDRTLVPVRAISEAYGAAVKWSDSENAVYIEK